MIVDPKGTDYAKYRGATMIKPNIHEAERAAGAKSITADDLQEVAAHLSRLLEGSAILITRGAEGMSLFAHGLLERRLRSIFRPCLAMSTT